MLMNVVEALMKENVRLSDELKLCKSQKDRLSDRVRELETQCRVQQNELSDLRSALSQPSEIRIDTHDQWISVSDRYPVKELAKSIQEFGENDVEVIVMIDGADVATTLYYDGHDFRDADGDTYHVTAWMPLPDVYIPERQLYDGE